MRSPIQRVVEAPTTTRDSMSTSPGSSPAEAFTNSFVDEAHKELKF